MKKCTRCHRRLPTSSFNFKDKASDKLQSACRDCQNQLSKEHYTKNKAAYFDKNKRNHKKIRQWYRDYKTRLSCVRCGESHPACIQFHHKDKTNKEADVANTVTRAFGWGIERIKREISKCEVLCANCHCKEHWNDFKTKTQRSTS